MNVLDLFSGIGGFSLGLERAGMRPVAFCEIDPWCQRVLRKHWPTLPVYDDIRELTGERLRADGIAVGSFVKTLLLSNEWHSERWWLIWKGSDTKSRHRLKFRLVPLDTITGGHVSGFVATPTTKANQNAPSMKKWPCCAAVDLSPEATERRMGFPLGWTDLEP